MTDRSSETFFRGMVEVRPSNVGTRSEFTKGVKEIVEEVEREVGSNQGWWVIGGVARDAILGNQEFVVQSPDGEWRDVDLLASRATRNALQRFKNRYNGMIGVHGSSIQEFIDIPPDGDAALRFGSIKVSVPKEVFTTQMRSLGGVPFPTVPPETLLHLYAVGDRPGGKMREKDFLNALDLARYIKENPSPDFPESMYVGFHEFARRKNNSDSPNAIKTLRDMGRAYRESRLNQVIPINRGWLNQACLHIYNLVQDVEAQVRK